jgi:hypothetical protein
MRRFLLAAVACLALTGGVAEARPIPDKGMTIEEVAAWLKAAGFEPKIEKTKDGASYVHSSANGVNFNVDLYDCAEGHCRALQFIASFDLKEPLAAAKANEWNMRKRYLRLYLDEGGDPTFVYDANVAPGGTFEALQDHLDIFVQFLPEILEHIGW